MKVAFFSDRPFGLRGTPGTYLFVAKLLAYVDALIFTPIGDKDIVYSSKNIPVHRVASFKDKAAYEHFIRPLRHFDPDIIYIYNFRGWYALIEALKTAFPTKKYILDIKTPLLIEHRERRIIQEEGSRSQHYLDSIVGLSEESVKTWIPDCSRKPVIYPLGIDVSLFRESQIRPRQQRCRRFVYIGVLHPKRQVHVLLDFFTAFTRHSSQPVSLDIYGSGSDEERLRKMLACHGSEGYISMGGLWPQRQLLDRLPDYDCGIAWVPYDHYDNSPSLKALEYMASGLPILASDTTAHRSLAEHGFTVDLFSNDKDSFCAAMGQIVGSGFARERIEQNRAAVAKFDYDAIIRDYFLPLFAKLTGQALIADPPRLPMGSPSPSPLSAYKHKEVSSTGRVRPPHPTNGGLKLVLLCNTLANGKGGAERVAVEVANAMAERGHSVRMIYEDTGRLPAYPSNDGVELFPYASPPSALAEQIRVMDPSVFFAFYFDRTLLQWYSLVHNTNIPFGMQECTNPERLVNNWARRGLEPEIANWEREIIGSAAARIRLTMSDYTSSFPSYIQPYVRAFPNPASPQYNYADPAGRSVERKVIINIGGMKKNKNLKTLLQAFASLAPMFPDWDIKVFGNCTFGGAPHESEILDFIETNGLLDRVRIYGPVDDIFAELAAAHLHVISSLSEGCPTSILEAMATGLPSVGFADCPGTNQLIGHEENGLLATPADRVTSLRSALEQLMGSADTRVRMGRQALEDSKGFNPGQAYDRWETLFYEAAEYKNDPGRLLREQKAIDPERAAHVQRCRGKLLARAGGTT